MEIPIQLSSHAMSGGNSIFGAEPQVDAYSEPFFLLTLSQNVDNSVSLPISHETRHSLVYAAISARRAGRLHPRLKDFLVSDKQ